ncbi:LacI family DNA-binding transcriptional regulator [Sedimentibacter hydroxybenzoicus DSM 7310]|uniref:LacI family DNA-binding transcriptional regulator n=1 Tax=Sedimentibacter hydroxybenzoicus DSM 7310 TaxID=1123245 RepID=A0A974BIE9_SEDHY|nr:LacI family DNA-binding transcriptional regulator [Sedimentibacter hydroxybenzoicus]NYB73471.1 LacI family DNA-binding transcriptional regulator [Sedimentibacter hydroxybenzoicus DSM 7310]
MKITIKEIAKEAGVSIATVSMILNNKDKNITHATRVRVLDAVKKYNYVPNAMAGSLVTQKTHIVGLILPDITNPFFPGIARGAEDKANESGYSIIFCNTDDKLEVEEKYIETLTKKMADGIIIAHSSGSEKMSEILERCKVPIILIDRDFYSEKVCGKVLVNNLEGAYKGVSYLINKGYTKIAFLSGSLKTRTARDRLDGYKKALSDNGLEYDEKLVKYGEYKIEWGKDGVNELLSETRQFDSIFCGNDLIAIGAIKELKKNGYSIPGDVGVMGFDDIYLAGLVEPSLTTVRQPNYKMGYQAMELLLETLNDPDKKNNNFKEMEIITLDTEIIERNSI